MSERLWDITYNRERWFSLAGRIKQDAARWEERLKTIGSDENLSSILKHELIYLSDKDRHAYFKLPQITGARFAYASPYPIIRVDVGLRDGRRRNIGREKVGGDSFPFFEPEDMAYYGEFVPLSFNQIGEIIARRLGTPGALRNHTVSQPKTDFKPEQERVGTNIMLKREALERKKRQARESQGKQQGEMPKRDDRWRQTTTPHTQEGAIAAPRPKARILLIRDRAAYLRGIKDGTTLKTSRWLVDYLTRYYDTETNYIIHAQQAEVVDESSFWKYTPADSLEPTLGSPAMDIALKIAKEARDTGDKVYAYYFFGGEMQKGDIGKCGRMLLNLALNSTLLGLAEFVSPKPAYSYTQIVDHLPIELPHNMRVRRRISEVDDVWPTLYEFHKPTP